MYIYNVTINIEESIHEEWLAWINNHIQDVLDTGKFEKAYLIKVLVEDEIEGATYSVQYHCKSRELLDAYYKEDADRLRSDALGKFGNNVLSFRTELKIIQEFQATSH